MAEENKEKFLRFFSEPHGPEMESAGEQKPEAKEKRAPSGLPVIRTLKSDAARYASREKTSVLSAAAAQLKRRRQEISEKPEHHGLWGLLITGLVLLLALAGAGIYYFYFLEGPEPVPGFPPPAILINVDEEARILLDPPARDALVRLADEALYRRFENGFYRAVLFYRESQGGRLFMAPADFLRIAEIGMPSRLRNNIGDFTLGSLDRNAVVHPFIIFRVNSYLEAFAGVLEWENIAINELRPFFRNIPQIGESRASFRDIVIKNQDSRILEIEGVPVLVYGFFNQNLLIITDTPEALERIISRYEIFPPRSN